VPKLSDQEFIDLRTYIDKIGLEHIIFGSDYHLYRNKECLNILKDKVGLSDQELKQIMM